MSSIFPVLPPVSPDLFAILRADLRYFERRPERRHRLRLATGCEIEDARRMLGLVLPPPGARVFCGVQSLGPGNVHRVIGFAVDAEEVDFDEKAAARAYRRLSRQDVTAHPAEAALWRAVPSPQAYGGEA